MPEGTCCIEGCGRQGRIIRKMCEKHYYQWRMNTPRDQRPPVPGSMRDFWDFVNKTHEFGCWVWTGTRSAQGYGAWGKKSASRHSWELANGPIPEGMWVLHHCDNKPCVNPKHLYIGTVVENVLDAVVRGRNYVPPLKTACKEGHLLEGDNLREIRDSVDNVIQRLCRTCDNKRSREFQRGLRVKRRAVRQPPSEDRISTTEAMAKYGVSRATIIRWGKLGRLSEAIRYERNSYWIEAEVAAEELRTRWKRSA